MVHVPDCDEVCEGMSERCEPPDFGIVVLPDVDQSGNLDVWTGF